MFCEDESEDEGAELGEDFGETEDEEERTKAAVNEKEGKEKAVSVIDQTGTDTSRYIPGITAEETERRTFRLHKSFACWRSPYFDRAFNNPSFIEAATQRVVVQADPEIMAFLIEWIYIQDLEISAPNVRQCAQLWIMADRFLMPALQNAAMTRFKQLVVGNTKDDSRESLDLDVKLIAHIWNRTCELSQLRRVLVAMWPLIGNQNRKNFEEDLKENGNLLPQELLLQIATELILSNGRVDIAEYWQDTMNGDEGLFLVREKPRSPGCK